MAFHAFEKRVQLKGDLCNLLDIKNLSLLVCTLTQTCINTNLTCLSWSQLTSGAYMSLSTGCQRLQSLILNGVSNLDDESIEVRHVAYKYSHLAYFCYVLKN